MSLLHKLSPKVQPYAAPVDGDPVAGISAAEVAAALGEIPANGPAEVFRLKWASEAQAGRDVLELLHGYLATERIRKLPREVTLPGLARSESRALALVVLGSYIAPEVCLYCLGNGKVPEGHSWRSCGPCRGSGHGVVREADLAAQIPVSVRHWRQRYKVQYEDALAQLGDWERRAIGVVLRSLTVAA